MADFAAEEVLLGVMVASSCNCCDRWVYYIVIIVYILVPCLVMTNTELGRRRLWFDYDHYDVLRRCSLGPFGGCVSPLLLAGASSGDDDVNPEMATTLWRWNETEKGKDGQGILIPPLILTPSLSPSTIYIPICIMPIYYAKIPY